MPPLSPIPNERARAATLSKRKLGLIKKAQQLSLLCECQVGVLICSSKGKWYEYASSDMDELLLKYTRDYVNTHASNAPDSFFHPKVRLPTPESPPRK